MNIEKLQLWHTLERLNAAYYFSMADALENVNWSGTAAWMRAAGNDEVQHAERVAAYLVDVGQAPEWQALEEIPELSGADLMQYFNAGMVREQDTTAFITGFANECLVDGDMQTLAMILNPDGDWPGFVAEQTKSERDIKDIQLMLERAAGNNAALVLIDQQLGEKVSG